jgi:hypothetical protein
MTAHVYLLSDGRYWYLSRTPRKQGASVDAGFLSKGVNGTMEAQEKTAPSRRVNACDPGASPTNKESTSA